MSDESLEKLRKLFESSSIHEDENIIESAEEPSTELAEDEQKSYLKKEWIRKDSLRQTIHNLSIIVIKGIVIYAGILAFVLLCNYILPENLRWLDDQSIDNIEVQLKSGALISVGSLLTNYVKSIMKD